MTNFINMQNRGFPAGESFQFVYSRQNPVFLAMISSVLRSNFKEQSLRWRVATINISRPHSPDKAGKFLSNSSFCHIGTFVLGKYHPIVYADKCGLEVVKFRK